MSGKVERKFRQIHRKTMQKQVDRFFEQVVRPKPVWLPDFIWWRLVNRVLKIQTEIV